jgi:ankyrin repeat protein
MKSATHTKSALTAVALMLSVIPLGRSFAQIGAGAQSSGPDAKKSTAKSSVSATALHEAEHKNDVETVKTLIRQGADVNAKARGWPVLVAAASEGYAEMTGLLLQSGAKVNEKEESNGGTALFWAAMQGYPDVVKLLLDKKADPNVKSTNGTTPLGATALSGNVPEATRIAIAEMLLKNGANINEPGFLGTSPRGGAASNGFSQLADFLRKHGGKCVVSSTIPHNCKDE